MLTNKMVFVCVMWGSLKGLQAGVRDVHRGSTTMKAIVCTYANSMKNGRMDDVFVWQGTENGGRCVVNVRVSSS